MYNSGILSESSKILLHSCLLRISMTIRQLGSAHLILSKTTRELFLPYLAVNPCRNNSALVINGSGCCCCCEDIVDNLKQHYDTNLQDICVLALVETKCLHITSFINMTLQSLVYELIILICIRNLLFNLTRLKEICNFFGNL